MTPERYRRVVEIFEHVCDCSPEYRAAFIARACASDDGLRKEVEAMVNADGASSRFFEAPPDDIAAEIVSKQSRSLIGRDFGEYQVVARLGTGGMGEVYLAQDTRLGRKAALKFLSEEYSGDPVRLRRFEQEARAVSALNHPNIVTVYGFGQAGPTTFIATEFVEGRTLRDELSNGPLPLASTVEIALHAVSALTAAHAAGIVHRDIKPENIILRPDGLVKILDFGIAKRSAGSASLNISKGVNTLPGLVVGTPRYMSPEQARGLPVDLRTDLFSLGAVLYEMIAGSPAITGENPSDILVALLAQDPVPLEMLRPRCPAALVRIVRRCLEKDRDKRYSSAQEMLSDLKSAQQEIQSGSARPIAPTFNHSGRSGVTYLLNAKNRIVIGIAVLAVLTTAIGMKHALILRRWWAAAGSEHINSLAVLPLTNPCCDKGRDYIADGMTEALITELGKIRTLRVISRTSIMTYKGTQKRVSAIARELNVDAVVEGAIITSGDRLRLNARLIDASSDRQLWQESFDRDIRDIVSLQSNLAQSISNEIHVTLVPEQKSTQTISSRRPDPRAVDLYLHGLAKLRMASARLRKDSDDKKDFSEAIAYFEKATTVDPQYAPGYVGLADAYTRMGMRRMLAVNDVKWKAKEAAERALELDPMMAQAYVVAGQIAAEFETKWSDSERLHRRALELEPGNSECHRSYANFVAMPTLRFDEALLHFKQAELLDPFNNYLKVEVGRCLYNARRYREAIHKLSYIVNTAPGNIDGHYMLGLTYLGLKQYPPAIIQLEKAVALSGNAPGPLSYLSNAVGSSGDRVRAAILHKELLSMSKTRYVPDHFIAISLIGQGRIHEAIAMLRKALLANTISGTFFDSPIYQDLRNNSEFVALSQKFPPPIPHKPSRP